MSPHVLRIALVLHKQPPMNSRAYRLNPDRTVDRNNLYRWLERFANPRNPEA